MPTVNMPLPETTTVLVYAGGRATRMGGVNKAMALRSGRPLIEHVLERTAGSGVRVVLSANRPAAEFGLNHPPILPDVRPGFPGPLGALEALAASPLLETEWVLTVPCDAPALPLDLGRRLSEAVHDAGALAAYARAGGRPQFTCALVHRSLLKSVGAYLDAGERRVGGWLRRCDAVAVDWEDEGGFLNVNESSELDADAGACLFSARNA